MNPPLATLPTPEPELNPAAMSPAQRAQYQRAIRSLAHLLAPAEPPATAAASQKHVPAVQKSSNP